MTVIYVGYQALDAHVVKRSADVWIEESSRPYSVSISEMVDSGNARRFGIVHLDVESCLANLMIAADGFTPDTVMAAVSIFFINIVWRFKVRLPSLLQFAENFLTSGEKKPVCWAMRQWLSDDFDSKVSRYDTVKLSRAVNATKVLEGTRAYDAAHNGELSKKYY